jgi:voltage-gated potassium channel
MPFFLRLVTRLTRTEMRVILLGLVIVYAAVYPFMLGEPSDPTEKDLSNPFNYTWFFIVTVATVGYGDMSPVTTMGRIGGAVLILTGVALLAVVIGKIGSWIFQRRERMLSGLKPFKVSGHAVIIGYFPNRTRRLVHQLHTGGHEGEVVLICAGHDQATTHPMPDIQNVLFVRGDLEDLSFLRDYANLPQASRIIIDGPDDPTTIAMALAVDELNCSGHIVAVVGDISRQDRIHRINRCIEVVPRDAIDLIVDAAHEPGISEVYAAMQDNRATDASAYSVMTPSGWTGASLDTVETFFRRNLRARVIGIREGSHLDDHLVVEVVDDYTVKGGYTIYYVASNRLRNIPWHLIGRAPMAVGNILPDVRVK